MHYPTEAELEAVRKEIQEHPENVKMFRIVNPEEFYAKGQEIVVEEIKNDRKSS